MTTEREGDPRRMEFTWSIRCQACGTSSSGGAESAAEAFEAMARFERRSCLSKHFDMGQRIDGSLTHDD